MQNELLNLPAGALANSNRIQRLVADFLAGRKPTTMRTYSQCLADFANFTGAIAIDDAARLLLTMPHGEANHLVLNYRNDLVHRNLAANTVNARLAALRSLVK